MSAVEYVPRDAIGIACCWGCRKPIMDDDHVHLWKSDWYFHPSCYRELLAKLRDECITESDAGGDAPDA